MTKTICPKCKGRGLLTFDVVNIFNIFGIQETTDCNACYGKGWIY